MDELPKTESALPAAPAWYWRWFRNLVAALGCLTLLVFLFSWTARLFFVAELVVSFQAQLLVLVAIAFALALSAGWRKLGIGLGVALVWLVLQWGWLWIPPVQPAAGPESIRIMSFNVLTTNRQADAVQQRIAAVDPDVLIVVEYDWFWHQELESLHRRFPFSYLVPRWHGYGIACFSKRPFHQTETVQLIPDRTDTPMILVEVPIGERRIRLAGIHLISPTNAGRLKLRNAQLADIAEHLPQSSTPTVLMGDFNCTPSSPYFQDLLGDTGLRDSRQGFGYQATWNRELWPLMIPIDHFLISPDCHVHNRFTASAAGSDHLPIVIDISVTESR